jgi:hypothetical protein
LGFFEFSGGFDGVSLKNWVSRFLEVRKLLKNQDPVQIKMESSSKFLGLFWIGLSGVLWVSW